MHSLVSIHLSYKACQLHIHDHVIHELDRKPSGHNFGVNGLRRRHFVKLVCWKWRPQCHMGAEEAAAEAPRHLAPRQAPLACVALIDFRLQYFQAAYRPPFSRGRVLLPLHYKETTVMVSLIINNVHLSSEIGLVIHKQQ